MATLLVNGHAAVDAEVQATSPSPRVGIPMHDNPTGDARDLDDDLDEDLDEDRDGDDDDDDADD